MLSYEEIKDHLASIQYKPGWTWNVEIDPWEGLYIRFLISVEDSYSPGQTVDLGFSSWLPPMTNRKQLDLWLQWRIWRLESHEAREFMRRDNRPIFDPHAIDDI